MKKAAAIDQWRNMPAGQPILKHMLPIVPGTTGSRYGCCGIRIDGNPAFVDAVLSHLKDLLDGENGSTRLELARNPVKHQPGYNAGQNADEGAECCYIRLHWRGRDARAMNALFGGDEQKAATRRFADVAFG